MHSCIIQGVGLCDVLTIREGCFRVLCYYLTYYLKQFIYLDKNADHR